MDHFPSPNLKHLVTSDRLQSCETAFELLERYAAMSQTTHAWMDSMTETVNKMPPVENGQLESTAVCLYLPTFNHFFFLFFRFSSLMEMRQCKYKTK